jgi:hypothetical protein
VRRSVHGVQVAVTGSLPASLLGELLGGFPEGDPGREPDLAVSLDPASAPPDREGRPIFFHGVVRAREIGGAVVLTDGHSSARVAPGGGRIELSVAPASLRDPHTFEHVLALIALVLALRQRGLFHVHAAGLVRADGRAVLVAGPAGSGKSTLALALLEHGGLGYLGDDAVFLAARPEGMAVLACPRDFHVSDRTVAAFPRLTGLVGERYALVDKRRLDARRAFPGRERASAGAPAVLLLPELAEGAVTSAEAVPVAHGLGALIESSALVAVEGLPAAADHLAVLGRSLHDAACSRVRLGADLLEDPGRAVAALPIG